MNTYTYKNVFTNEVLLTVKSSNISEADKIFEKETGLSVVKSKGVVVSISFCDL